jgi:hypothetical protein
MLSLARFTATSISSLHTTINGALVTVDFNVLGTFLPGTGWLNAGSNFTASQSWLLSQTGGQGKTISMNGTFPIARQRSACARAGTRARNAGFVGIWSPRCGNASRAQSETSFRVTFSPGD